MPDPAEVLAYEAGVRFRQFGHYYSEVIHATGRRYPVQADYVALEFAIRKLGDALKPFTAEIGIEDTLVEMGQQTVQRCLSVWTQWATPDRTKQGTEDNSGPELGDSIDQLDELTKRFAESVKSRLPLASSWLALGKEICRRDWQDSPFKAKHEFLPLTPPLVEWEFVEIKKLLGAVGKTLDELRPKTPICGDLVRLLPYDPSLFRAWFQVELGLIELRRCVTPAIPPDPTPTPLGTVDDEASPPASSEPTPTEPNAPVAVSTGDAAVPPSTPPVAVSTGSGVDEKQKNAILQPGYLGLVLDRKNRQIRRGTVGVDGPRKQLWHLLSIFMANAESFANAEGIQAKLGSTSRDATIRAVGYLGDFLKGSGLGVTIEFDEWSGYRLVESEASHTATGD